MLGVITVWIEKILVVVICYTLWIHSKIIVYVRFMGRTLNIVPFVNKMDVF